MSRLAKWSLPVLAFAMMVGFAGIRAEAQEGAAEKGKVTGILHNDDGTPAANVTVRLMAAASKAGKKAEKEAAKGGAAPQAADAAAPADGSKPADGDKPEGKKERPKPVATSKTDAAGKFELEAPAGKYTVQANMKGQGSARQTVEIKAGETKDVGTLTLKQMPKKEATPAT